MPADAEERESMQTRTAEELLKWCEGKFGTTAALATSFGVEDMVLLDMISKCAPTLSVFTLDTGRLPEETYRLMDLARERYPIKFEVYCPETDRVEEMVTTQGLNLFYRSVDLRKRCCHVRKVEPLLRALKGKQAWITGLRRDQTASRAEVAKVAVDHDHGDILKLSPLAEWTEAMIWDYVREHKVPYNELHDRGYPSIGCAPCTRAIAPGEDIRAGRWWWEQGTKECGLHEQVTNIAQRSPTSARVVGTSPGA